MSENVQLVERMYAAFDAGDATGSLSHFAEDVVVDATNARPDAPVGRGREALARIVGQWTSTFDGWSETIEDIRDLGNSVFVQSTQRGRANDSGVDAEARYAMLYDVSDGVITGVRMFRNPEEALRSTGAD